MAYRAPKTLGRKNPRLKTKIKRAKKARRKKK